MSETMPGMEMPEEVLPESVEGDQVEGETGEMDPEVAAELGVLEVATRELNVQKARLGGEAGVQEALAAALSPEAPPEIREKVSSRVLRLAVAMTGVAAVMEGLLVGSEVLTYSGGLVTDTLFTVLGVLGAVVNPEAGMGLVDAGTDIANQAAGLRDMLGAVRSGVEGASVATIATGLGALAAKITQAVRS